MKRKYREKRIPRAFYTRGIRLGLVGPGHHDLVHSFECCLLVAGAAYPHPPSVFDSVHRMTERNLQHGVAVEPPSTNAAFPLVTEHDSSFPKGLTTIIWIAFFAKKNIAHAQIAHRLYGCVSDGYFRQKNVPLDVKMRPQASIRPVTKIPATIGMPVSITLGQ